MKNRIRLNENRIRGIINESIRFVLNEKCSTYSSSINIADKYWDEFFDTIDYDTNQEECDKFYDYCNSIPRLFDITIYIEEQEETDDYGSPLGTYTYTTSEIQGIDDEFESINSVIQDYQTDDEQFKQTASDVLEDVMYGLDVDDF